MARSRAQLIFYVSHVYQRMTPPSIQFVNHNIQEFSLISLSLPYPHKLLITIAHHFAFSMFQVYVLLSIGPTIPAVSSNPQPPIPTASAACQFLLPTAARKMF